MIHSVVFQHAAYMCIYFFLSGKITCINDSVLHCIISYFRAGAYGIYVSISKIPPLCFAEIKHLTEWLNEFCILCIDKMHAYVIISNFII